MNRFIKQSLFHIEGNTIHRMDLNISNRCFYNVSLFTIGVPHHNKFIKIIIYLWHKRIVTIF